MSGINAALVALIPKCAKRVAPASYAEAIRCETYREAYDEWLLPIKNRLPIPLVEPWERVEKNQMKVLNTTSQYSQGNTAPANLGRRSTEASRSVDDFSDGAHKPEHDGMRVKFSPKEKPRSKARAEKYLSRRIPEDRVCPGCHNDILSGMARVNGEIVQLVDHSKCGDQRKGWAYAPVAPKPSGMMKFKAKMQG
mgnify:CR=1 FL=1